MEEKIKTRTKSRRMNALFSIVGISLVLLILGIMGLLFLNLKQMGNKMKEDIRVSAYLQTENKDSINLIMNYIKAQPYAKDVVYIDKARAKEIWNRDNNEEWDQILDYNPLPESIDFSAKERYVNKDSLQMISSGIKERFSTQITDLVYPQVLVSSVNEKATQLGLIFLVIAIVLIVIVVVSIDNTIRLTMYSNRFLIKTMQMVGATRSFITRPMVTRAILNGLISAVIACVGLFLITQWAYRQLPQLKMIEDRNLTIALYAAIIILGVMISWISTSRSVVKYLKSRIENLY
ncbi:cell division protein FtsX [Haoranjiania flava]|uniref:Cell division protein FtsX n=1 Tax=Haoranjiania flava TaxID=1856322 RepID=A0AAE3IN98_9BACT|nr:permease-like cell division protein FtsX [Haoranjiania flava]MCU7694223.1 permease-like cell division protein FtsX [Haoranjiania flava]